MTDKLKDKLDNKKYRSHLKIIDKLVSKLEREGDSALKFLHRVNDFVLAELKVMKPPYRLYVYKDVAKKEYYVVEWEHKKSQQKTINELDYNLLLSIRKGFDNIFT